MPLRSDAIPLFLHFTLNPPEYFSRGESNRKTRERTRRFNSRFEFPTSFSRHSVEPMVPSWNLNYAEPAREHNKMKLVPFLHKLLRSLSGQTGLRTYNRSEETISKVNIRV